MAASDDVPIRARVERAELKGPVRLEGFWPLPSPLVVHAETIGQTFPVRFGDHAAEIHMPRFDRPGGNRVRPPLCATIGFGDSFEWGYTTLFSLDAARHCEINGVGVVVGEDPDSIDLDELGVQVESWLAIAVVWLEVMSNQTLTANEAVRTTYHGGTLHYVDASSWTPGDASTKPFFVDDTIDAIRSAGLVYAFDQASSGNTLPLSWRLFLRGRRAHQTDDHRVAIVEAANAVEQALSAALRQVATTQSSGSAQQLLSKHLERRTLGAQVDDVKSVNLLPLPDNTRADLVTARNRTVHHGHQPSAQEAAAALEIAEWILGQVSPLFTDNLALVERRSDVART